METFAFMQQLVLGSKWKLCMLVFLKRKPHHCKRTKEQLCVMSVSVSSQLSKCLGESTKEHPKLLDTVGFLGAGQLKGSLLALLLVPGRVL